MPENPQLISPTYVGFAVNAAMENRNRDVSFEDVYKSLEQGKLFEKLYEQIPNQFDFSLLNLTVTKADN